ncbi:hypothetical protein [Cryobacterium sp. HLT2-28]|uniref:hypothetical protein n=1 Tax=Cryobacterium sp. HLT2-28 TaxID=1259146 RepID=UPI001069CE2C|nr:hypothetical protein E3O48_05680 [Cryobacterium sp. HLT2-28]
MKSKEVRSVSTIVVTLGTIGVILLWPFLTSDLAGPAFERIGTTSILSSWTSADSLTRSMNSISSSAEYTQVAYEGVGNVLSNNGGGDASNLIRFYRWHILLNSMSVPLDLPLGLGPSFPGPSVDGAFLRIFVETGILGSLAWLALFRRWFRSVPNWFAAAAVTVLIGSIFIDLTFALRPMVLLWLLFAIAKFEIQPASLANIKDEIASGQSTYLRAK